MTRPRLVALYRRASFSPRQHLQNDRAILDHVVRHLEELGWLAERLDEDQVEHGRIPRAELYLNMCQGAGASELLAPLECDGVTVVNRASSVLNCHRHRLVHTLAGSGVEFPHTILLPAGSGPPEPVDLADLVDESGTVWLKRGDVHAERTEDVLRLRPEELGDALDQFSARGIAWAALQRHVPGPVIKFYALADRSFFRYYGAERGYHAPPPPVDERALAQLAYTAAERLGLEVFGGDVAVPSPDRPVLIDINDWPSFAPFRDEAGRAIAHYVHQQARLRSPA
ncbi:MAG TPA: hypothetical protein VNH46_13925 [Gemmatimonadales bacterium]|nr:hypothetical protein [Gemmatimonadales bacterium]